MTDHPKEGVTLFTSDDLSSEKFIHCTLTSLSVVHKAHR